MPALSPAPGVPSGHAHRGEEDRTGIRPARHPRQQRHAQALEGQGVEGEASAGPLTLRAHLGLLAEPGGVLFLTVNIALALISNLEQRWGTRRHDNGLHQGPEPGTYTGCLDRHGEGFTGNGR